MDIYSPAHFLTTHLLQRCTNSPYHLDLSAEHRHDSETVTEYIHKGVLYSYKPNVETLAKCKAQKRGSKRGANRKRKKTPCMDVHDLKVLIRIPEKERNISSLLIRQDNSHCDNITDLACHIRTCWTRLGQMGRQLDGESLLLLAVD